MSLFYPESRFGGYTDVDGTIAFYTRVHSLLTPDSVVLDVGCGRGQYADDPVRLRRELRVFGGKCRKVIGIDVDEAAGANPYLDEFHLLAGPQWPLSDGVADICICDAVLEHVEDPESFFGQCRRILKPGGYLCIRTPNVMSYFGLMSMLIPNRRHAAVLERVQDSRKHEDVFPTVYKCNTRRKIRRMFRKHGLVGCVYGYEAEPSYLSFSRLFYALGVLHQKLAPKALKVTLFAFAERQA